LSISHNCLFYKAFQGHWHLPTMKRYYYYYCYSG
jgi:hypothetical protein